MRLRFTRRRATTAIAILGCIAVICGCAGWQGPRIDPSGERIFVWPGETPAPVVAGPPVVTGPPVIAPPPGAPVAPVVPAPAPIVAPPAAVVPLPAGNVQAPPVYSDPTVPTVIPSAIPTAPVIPAIPAPAIDGVIPAAVPIVPGVPTSTVGPITFAPLSATCIPGVIPAVSSVCATGSEQVRISPDHVVAPVGSMLALKAGICGGNGYLVANQPIEWSVAPNGVGQLGDHGIRDPLQLVAWMQAPQKPNDCSAVGTTAFASFCLNAATPDPGDDVPIQRGETWVTVTSACEGISHVTAAAPEFGCSQATATIHWLDVQWLYAASAIEEVGRAHVLTTTVMRRTDGAPLAGYLVRYEVSNGASLGYEGGSATEVPTDANGRASVEVSPTETGGGTANVVMTIIRPESAGPDGLPRFEMGRNNATITWGAAAPALPFVPAPPAPAPSLPPTGPPPMVPPVSPTPPPPPPPTVPSGNVTPPPALPNASPAPPSAPPASAVPQGRPRLEVEMRRVGPEQVAVGDYATFDVTVVNRGDGVARGIRVEDHFDKGLRHPHANPSDNTVRFNNPGIRDLAPNESETIRLTFQVVDAGSLCHDLTASAEGMDAPVSQRGCVTARQAVLEVKSAKLRRQTVGDTADFRAVIKNVGDIAATNIEIVARSDAALKPTEAEPGSESLPDGGLIMRVARLEPSEVITFRMKAQCVSPGNNACIRFSATADGGVIAHDETCLEILPQLPAGAPGGNAAAPSAAAGLRLTVSSATASARVGEKLIIYVNVANEGQQAERQVSVRVLLPQELTPDAGQIQPQGEATMLDHEIRFNTIAEIPAGGQRQYVVPVAPDRTGKVQVRAQIATGGQPTPVTVESGVIEILPRS
jgi:uncharacterized repeat protein (TIGR01451 family)